MNHEIRTDSIFSSTPIQLLDQFLRGELAAAATYEQAVLHVKDPVVRAVLEQCRQSHASRSVALAQEIRRRDVYPSETAGIWGTFTKLVEQGASLFGDDAIVKALQLGEQEGLESYEAGVVALDEVARRELEPLLLNAQQETLGRVTALSAAASA